MTTVQKAGAHAFAAIDEKYLTERAIDLQVAHDEGLRSIDESEVHRTTGNITVVGGGLAQAYRMPLPPPWDGAHGVHRLYYRIQLHERDANGGRKTDVPTGPVPAYFTSSVTTSPESPIFVVESPIKALSLASNGYPETVGLGGVRAGLFEKGSQMKVLQSHLAPYFSPGRPVYVVFDANRSTNADVADAEAKTCRALIDRGCLVRVVEIPAEFGAEPGPDDFIAKHGKARFAELVLRARDADPVKHAEAVSTLPARARALLQDLPFCASLQVGGPGVRKSVCKALSAFFSKSEIDWAWKNHAASQARASKLMVAQWKNGGGSSASSNAWRASLIVDKNGNVRPVTANYTTIVENDPALTGVIAFDELANEIVFTRSPGLAQFLKRKAGDQWTDEDDVSAANWLQQQHVVLGARPLDVRGVVALAAKRNAFCPLRRTLQSLSWDGVPRVDSWLVDYCGVDRVEYSMLVGRWWLISAVARAFDPGCQVDHALVLEGAQGAGKSSVFRILAFDGRFYADSLRDLGSAEAAKQLRSKWICELAELAAVTRREVEAVKAFVTCRVDNYRPSYGRTALDFPRRVVFGGSVNPVSGQGYLKDVTGDRRWWPVTVGKVDLDALARDRDQLWAEAVVLHRAGERWHPTRDEAARLFAPEQAARREEDAFEAPLRTWLEEAVKPGASVTTQSILSDALGMPVERHGAAIHRVRKVMHVLGWEPAGNVRVNGKQLKGWRRGPDAEGYREGADGLVDVGDRFEKLLGE